MSDPVLSPAVPFSDYKDNFAFRFDPQDEQARYNEGDRIGVSRPHESAWAYMNGTAQYTDDVPERQGTLHGAVGLSPVAKGRVLSIDIAAIQRMPGVVLVLTGADVPGLNDCGTTGKDEPILASQFVEHYGQPVFAVIARTRDQARRAAALAPQVLQIAAEEPVLTKRKAFAQNQLLFPVQSLIRSPNRDRREEVRAAIGAAPHRLQGRFAVGGQEQFYLEGQISYVIPTENGGVHVYCSTQHTSGIQTMVAVALGVQEHAVLVEARRIGDGFGGKETNPGKFASIAAIAAKKLNRPVKIRVDRDDDIMVTGRRHSYWHEYEVGYDDAGRILALDLKMVSNGGFAADLSGAVMQRALTHVDNAYWIPNVAIDGYTVKTNTQSNTAFRGFGGPQGPICTEAILERIARRLGKDPLDVRKANFYGKTERNITPYGEVISDNVIHELVQQLETSSDYRKRREEIRAFNAGSPVIKRGIALTPVKFGISFNAMFCNQAGALIHIYLDGSILVSHGGIEMGQGLYSKILAVVAQTLGVDYERIRMAATDTSKVANVSATAASTGADLNGMAVFDAARQLRERLAAFAAGKYGDKPENVRFANDHVYVAGKQIPFGEVANAAYYERVQLWSDGFYKTPEIYWDAKTNKGHTFYYYAYGAAVSEVSVDTLTGEWKLLRADLLHDVGDSLNPATDIGQIEGGYVQGLGWLTTEELIWHPKSGKLMTHGPSTYKIPTANDCPPVFNVQLFKNSNVKETVYRSKAVGEPPLLLSFSAFFAISDAVAAVGDYAVTPNLRAPATSERILKAVTEIQAARAESSPTGVATGEMPRPSSEAELVS